MCLYNCNKENKKYKHITYAQRTMIETWYNQDHKSKKEIAELLHKSERMTRQEIIMKLPNKETKTIAKAIDKIERKYGAKFYKTFKTITFDNGAEFRGYEGIEKSCMSEEKRTVIYYAHPYCSGERGTNENNNRMIRRRIPKEIDMKDIKLSFIFYFTFFKYVIQ